jgi:apolipoprotein N-acyltransferase
MPFLFEEDPIDADRMRGHRPQRSTCRCCLAATRSSGARPTPPSRGQDLQRRVSVTADGTTGGVYRKMHLVPFGEYVPLKQLLFFAAPLVEAVSDFTAGESLELLPVGTHRVGTASATRLSIRSGAAVRGRRQRDAHDDHQRRVVRADLGAVSALRPGVDAGDRERPVSWSDRANTGISGIVDPYGACSSRRAIFQPAVVVGDARYPASSTFTRHRRHPAPTCPSSHVALLVARACKNELESTACPPSTI